MLYNININSNFYIFMAKGVSHKKEVKKPKKADKKK